MKCRPAAVTALLFAIASCGDFGKTNETDRWDAVYSRKDATFNTRPNAFLAEVLQGRKPGKALDIGMGQGRNTLLLAQMGWDVTGVDISGMGIQLAQQEAARLGLRIRTVRAPIEEFDLGRNQWDLVAAIYMHGVAIHNAQRIEQSLRPGGLLVVEGFHRDVMKLGADAVSEGELGYQTNALLRAFGGLRIEHYEDRMAFGDWMNRQAPIVRMVAKKE
jgi:2-polyprenyl-3-methyl-5-hydroxy-6-metoxy-1,4-benzoquinol methylase